VKDYYQIPGVKRDAGPEDIKKAFRRLALRHHPDRNPGNPKEAEHRFKEISEAHEVPGNEQKRHRYDYLTSYARSQTEKVRVNMVFGNSLDNLSYRNPEELLRIMVALNLDVSELFVEQREGRGKARVVGQCWRGYWR